MTYDNSYKYQAPAKKISIRELGGSTAVFVDVTPGDTFGQIAERVRQDLVKNAPVTLFNLSGQPFPPNEDAYSRVEDDEELRYQVTGIGG